MTTTAQALKQYPRTLSDLLRHPDFRQFGDTSDDWINDPERMARHDAAAVHGEDGSTHAERLDEMRENLRDIRRALGYGLKPRTEEILDQWDEAIEAEIDACEAWHAEAGSLHQLTGGGDPAELIA